jgi:hypothetical protein
MSYGANLGTGDNGYDIFSTELLCLTALFLGFCHNFSDLKLISILQRLKKVLKLDS